MAGGAIAGGQECVCGGEYSALTVPALALTHVLEQNLKPRAGLSRGG